MEARAWQLERETELRCEIGANVTVTVKLVTGTAEIFGVELAANKVYHFKGQNIAVFTWYGATLETTGMAEFYTSNETPMISYVNTHAQLEARRDAALASNDVGPRVMVVGQTDCGKSTLCRILTAYAVRLGRTPIYVDLDVGQGSITVAGCVAAVPLDIGGLSLEDGYTLNAPLAFFVGHNNLNSAAGVYKHFTTRLAHCVGERMRRDPEAQASGLVINTCGWVDGLGYQLLLHAIKAFEVDVLLVMGHDRLYAQLKETMTNNTVVVKLARSGGVVQRDSKHRRDARNARVHEYYYGSPLLEQPFQPSRMEMRLSELRIFRLATGGGSGAAAPGAAGAGGGGTADSVVTAIPVVPAEGLAHCVLGVCHVDEEQADAEGVARDDEGFVSRQVTNSNVAGFAYVMDIDLNRGLVGLLLPCEGALPSKYMIVGEIKSMLDA